MKGSSLYPFPRFDSEVVWSPITATIDRRPVELQELSDQWDAASSISFETSASMPLELHHKLGTTIPRLVFTGGCVSTGKSITSEAEFVVGSTLSSATAVITFPGCVLAGQVDLRASVIAPHEDIPWLSRRIIAQRGSEKVSLDSSLNGFPTTSISFKENKLIAAPWHIRVSAVSLTDPFAHSIQLILNEDYPRVVALIEGRAEPYVESALQRAVLRTIIHTAARLAAEEGDALNVEMIAVEYPDSIGAAAAKACSDYLQRDLPSVITALRMRPEHVEMWMASATDAIKENRR